MSEPPTGSTLPSDAQWARICEWLGRRGLVLHVPIGKPPYLTTRANVFVGML